MRRRSRGTGPEALKVSWRRWTAIVELFARRRLARRRVDPRAYQALHRELIATCRSLADSAGEESRAFYEGMEVLARPWLGPRTLEHADGAILASLLERCRQVEAELGVRRRFRPRITWSIKPLLVASALAALLALLMVMGVDLARALDQARGWSDVLWFAVKRSSDAQKLVAATTTVILASIYLASLRRQELMAPGVPIIPTEGGAPMRAATIWGERRPDRRGAALVEMAVILPVFVLIVFGILDAARLCMVSQLLTNAAREGCRVAVTTGKTTADVTARVNATLTAAGITPALVTSTLSPASIQTSKVGDPITLTLSVPFSDVNWLSTPFLYGTTNVMGKAVMSSERP